MSTEPVSLKKLMVAMVLVVVDPGPVFHQQRASTGHSPTSVWLFDIIMLRHFNTDKITIEYTRYLHLVYLSLITSCQMYH